MENVNPPEKKELLKELRSILKSDESGTETSEINYLLNNSEFLEKGFFVGFMVILFNHITMKHIYISKTALNLLGYTHKELLDYGVEWILKITHPEDLGYKIGVMKETVEELLKHEKSERTQFYSRYDYKAIRKDGTEIKLLEEIRYPVLSKTGMPIVSMYVIQDITNYKSFHSHVCTFHKYNVACNHLISTRYYSHQGAFNISEREHEILKLLAAGYNTEEISVRLGISIDTIKSHRKNIFVKLGAKNVADAIRLAFERKIL